MLEFVLRQLWDQQRGGELHHEAYQAMGGLQGAVAKKAEEVFDKLTPLEQEAVKRVFLQVVRAGETGEDTRRRAALSEIGSAAMDVVKKLADERLLVTNRAVAGENTVEVSHEALIRQWQRLQGWLNEDREFLLWRERLRGRVNEWQQNKQDEGTLLRSALLVEAQRWLSQKADMLTDEERDYIRHSVEARERAVQAEQQRAEQELAQAKRLAEEAAKREEAERARAAAAEQAQKAAEEAQQAEQARAQAAERAREAEARRAEAAERARRRQRYLNLALLILFLGMGLVGWLWKAGVRVQYAASIVLARLHLVQVPEPNNMVTISGGPYQQGSREVRIKPFAMGQYEVTFEEYDRYVELTGGKQPGDSGWGRGRRPVIYVSWDEAKTYAKWLSQATGKRFRLPTESEWEYAARSEGKDETWAGTSDEKQLADYAVYLELFTEMVGSKKPNGLGLHDMSGNVWEWVEDCWHVDYTGAPADGSAWLEANGEDCGRRVLRGGSWHDFFSEALSVSNRDISDAGHRSYNIGFRLAQDLEP